MDQLKSVVTQFYLRDAITRQSPGKQILLKLKMQSEERKKEHIKNIC